MNNTMRKERQGGILDELLKTPVFKDLIRSGARSMGHGNGRSLVKTIIGRDPEVFLSLVVTAPAMANVLIRALAELGTQLRNQYPPETLAPFLESMLGDIDTDSLKQCGREWKELLGSLLAASPDVVNKLADKILSSGPALTAQGINTAARGLNSLEENRPGTVSSFMSRTLDQVNRQAASSALAIVAGAVLDQKWGVLSWFFRLARARIKKRFGS